MSHYNALICAIKYIIDTKYYFYRMKSEGNLNGPCELRYYSDADYAGDNYTKKNCDIICRSNEQGSHCMEFVN